jgi:catechol 2,3-dioxygenase-like lactoylglutathione lyase family enzyme
MKLDNVTVLVTRFEDTFAFYRDVLGLAVTWGEATGNFASFAAGGSSVAIFRRELMADAIGAAALSTELRGPDQVSLVFAVDDVDAEAARLAARGVPVVSPPTDRTAWGIRVAYVRDPDGNLVGLFRALTAAP